MLTHENEQATLNKKELYVSIFLSFKIELPLRP